MRRIIFAITALAILGLAAWAFWPRPIDVETATVAPRTIDVVVEEEGIAEIREVFVVSAPIAGRMRRIDLHAGDPVTQGETIVALIGPVAPALLDARSRAVAEAGLAASEAAVDLARAQVTQAETTLDFSIIEAERAVALFDRAAIARQRLDGALLERDTAAAALDSARASLAVRERERDSAAAVLDSVSADPMETCCVELKAPVSGYIIKVLTENDQVVGPGTPILEIGDPGDLLIRVGLLSRDAVRVVPDAAARITGWGGADIAAEVERIEPSAVTRTSALGIDEQRVEVLLRLTGDPQQWQALGHGYRVVVEITLLTVHDVPSIPVGALFRDGSDWATFVVENGRARLRIIALGERDDAYAQVTDGLLQGDAVILHPSDLVGDDVAVVPLTSP